MERGFIQKSKLETAMLEVKNVKYEGMEPKDGTPNEMYLALKGHARRTHRLIQNSKRYKNTTGLFMEA